MKHFFLIFAAVLLLNHCATRTTVLTDTASEKTTKSETVLPSELEQEANNFAYLSPALLALLDTADGRQQAGDVQGASVQLERALRISPNEALLHLRLAEVRLAQGEANAALQLAFKGQALMTDKDRFLTKSFWRVIGDCYSVLGNYSKAAEAYQRAK